MFSGEYCEIFRNTFFYRTPPVAAFVFCKWLLPIYKSLFQVNTETTGNLFQVNSLRLCKPLLQYNHANLGRGSSWPWVFNLYHTIGLFLNTLKTRRFLIFSGGIERDFWHDVGECWLCANHLSAKSTLKFIFRVIDKLNIHNAFLCIKLYLTRISTKFIAK